MQNKGMDRNSSAPRGDSGGGSAISGRKGLGNGSGWLYGDAELSLPAEDADEWLVGMVTKVNS